MRHIILISANRYVGTAIGIFLPAGYAKISDNSKIFIIFVETKIIKLWEEVEAHAKAPDVKLMTASRG